MFLEGTAAVGAQLPEKLRGHGEARFAGIEDGGGVHRIAVDIQPLLPGRAHATEGDRSPMRFDDRPAWPSPVSQPGVSFALETQQGVDTGIGIQEEA